MGVDSTYTYKNLKRFELAEEKFNKIMGPESDYLASMPRFYRAMVQYDKMAKASDASMTKKFGHTSKKAFELLEPETLTALMKEKVKVTEKEIYLTWKCTDVAVETIADSHQTVRNSGMISAVYAFLIGAATYLLYPLQSGNGDKKRGAAASLAALIGLVSQLSDSIYRRIRDDKRVILLKEYMEFSARVKVELDKIEAEKSKKPPQGYVPMGSM